ncbi:toll/interleukin-1 receptor domain-containing protein [Azohydromonas caseinilytica]|uniref:TIR domain-containing protein n=1 Tax=Azohydromonas caseinilytica TaxID=2728836 RepID=A0A848FBT3_9BURK|nr:toll/interleukin-1 receptor domain-containing protein [Azohydromonas caseinilytica]NML16782.1 TIR domain-containing protein [Azohydromonas caseinilytica]
MSGVKARYHVLAFVLLVLLLLKVLDSLNELDWWLVAKLSPREVAWPEKLHVLDVPWDRNPATTGQFRRELAATLDRLAGLQPAPEAVIVDVSISALPLGLDELGRAVQSLVKKTPVFFAVDARRPGSDDVDPDFMQRMAGSQVYGRLHGTGARHGGWGHTEFMAYRGVVWFQPCISSPEESGPLADTPLAPVNLAVPASGCAIPSLAALVADSLNPARKPGWTDRSEPLVVFVGGKTSHLWRVCGGHFSTQGSFTGTQEQRVVPDCLAQDDQRLGGRIVIVGNVEYDRPLSGRGRHDLSGPELLGWSLAGLMSPSPTGAPATVLSGPQWLLGVPLVAVPLSIKLFHCLRRRVVRLRLRLKSAAALALALTWLLSGVLVAGLQATAYIVFPHVMFVVLASLAAVALSCHLTHLRLRDRALQENVSERSTGPLPAYDLFLSYSRTPSANAAWAAALHRALLRQQVDGRPLKVFFDKKSIHVGAQWYFTLAEAIECSRFFVAIYSNEYFHKNFCRFELSKAVIKAIRAQEFKIFPILKDPVAVPIAFNHLQTWRSGHVEALAQRIAEALRGETAVATEKGSLTTGELFGALQKALSTPKGRRHLNVARSLLCKSSMRLHRKRRPRRSLQA